MLPARMRSSTGWSDACILNISTRGLLIYALGSADPGNFVENGRLHTPTPDCFLDGITRRTVIDLAKKRGIEVVERAIWPEELDSFEQMFITGTAAEVTPIASAGPWSFEIGDLTLQLRSDYLDLVHRRLTNA